MPCASSHFKDYNVFEPQQNGLGFVLSASFCRYFLELVKYLLVSMCMYLSNSSANLQLSFSYIYGLTKPKESCVPHYLRIP